jgi:hypothetical protein
LEGAGWVKRMRVASMAGDFLVLELGLPGNPQLVQSLTCKRP